jgi:phospholipid/cholesterol/gamma-HCH transport system permease protein
MDIELISPSDWAKQQVKAVQDYAMVGARAVANLFTGPRYLADIIQQADLIGVGSLPIVVLTGFFTGGALAQNSGVTLERFGSLNLIGQLVSLGMVRELGPVITGLMVAGRNASGMASELGSMVVTEQIDAMRALGTDPMRKLVTPRVVATVVMLFFLTIISDAFGIFGGGVASALFFGVNMHQYWSSAWQILVSQDVFMGLLKPLFFGFIISSIGCYYGITARGGTQGVGRATTQAVVASSILIITVDFFVTRVSMTIFGS